MVEGPGCKLNGEKMKSVIVGQVVKTVSGNVIVTGKFPNNFQRLVGLTVIDVKTLGKELFIFFQNNLCVRLHFLMSGFVKYNNEHRGSDAKVPKAEAKLSLALTNDVVCAYECSVEMRPGEATLERWHNMITLDICWKEFDAKRAADAVLSDNNQNRLICDVVMDQEVLPGVGNIIKNEALFDAGIIPTSPVADLNPQLVANLIKMTRDFSMIFYDCSKKGKPLHKFYKMYMFSQCKVCRGRVTKCKPGEYKRGTYFCTTCQTNSIKRSRPVANSLLGWIQLGDQGTFWTCLTCTLENNPLAGNCVACGTARNRKKRKLDQQAPQGPAKKTKLTSDEETLRAMDVKDLIASGLASTKTPSDSNQENDPSNNGDFHLCKVHKKPCRKKIVSKEGENKGRSFWTCNIGRSCNYFAWADVDHPRCKHGDITFLREVYKLNKNNGKSFFVCPKMKKDQCDFFQWK